MTHQVTVDHPQSFDTSTQNPTPTIKSVDPSTEAPQPQQIQLHQSKPIAPAHAKVDHHHVDIHSGGPSISEASFMGTGIGGTVQNGHLASGASNKPFLLYIFYFSSNSIYSLKVILSPSS